MSHPGIRGEDDAGGKLVEIVGGESDGTTFYIADLAIIVDSFDGATTRPVDIGTGEKEIFTYLTLHGKTNGSRESASVTLIMSADGVASLFRGARNLWLNIPIEYRKGPSSDDRTNERPTQVS